MTVIVTQSQLDPVLEMEPGYGWSMTNTPDVILIGSGHQALVAAALLSKAGKRCLVLERNDTIGGATRSAEVTQPGLMHDLYATNLNQILISPPYLELKDDLARHGFEIITSDKPYANVFPGGKSLRIYQDQQKTEQNIAEHSQVELENWRELGQLAAGFTRDLMPMYGDVFPSMKLVRTAMGGLRRAGLNRLLEYAQILTMSTRELGEKWFDTDEVRMLLAAWGLHLDYGPDVSFGAMFPFAETFGDAEAGISIAVGGVSRLVDALAGVVKEHGGEVRTSADVVKVRTQDGHVTGVRLADGEEIPARTVVAGTSPKKLIEDLLEGESAVSPDTREKAGRYRYGPGTMMVHLALDKPVGWEGHEDLKDFAYVHVGPYVDDLARTYQQSLAGLIPDSPLLVVGQTSRVDKTRTPDDREVLWVQVRSLPSEIKGDALGEIHSTNWDDAKESVADRVVDKIDDLAPGFKASILERTVFSPLDLERDNPNLVGGDSVGGSHHVAQNFLFRPWLGGSRYTTDVDGLYLVGAGIWPGGGVNGRSGGHVAEAVLGRAESATVFDRAVGSLQSLGGGIGRIVGGFTHKR